MPFENDLTLPNALELRLLTPFEDPVAEALRMAVITTATSSTSPEVSIRICSYRVARSDLWEVVRPFFSEDPASSTFATARNVVRVDEDLRRFYGNVGKLLSTLTSAGASPMLLALVEKEFQKESAVNRVAAACATLLLFAVQEL